MRSDTFMTQAINWVISMTSSFKFLCMLIYSYCLHETRLWGIYNCGGLYIIVPVKNDRGSDIYPTIPVPHKRYTTIYATTMGEVKSPVPWVIHII